MQRKLTTRIIILCLLFGVWGCGTESVDSVAEGEGKSASVQSGAKDENGVEQEPVEETSDLEPKRMPKRNWKKIAEFLGSKSSKTKPFKIKGKEWKINWSVEEKGNDNGEFIIILHNKKDKNDTEIIAQQTGSGEDFAPFEGGQGEYYLEVQSSQPYSIEVQEYK